MLVSCDINITLNAIVIGDLTGHTVEWAQLSGPPVVWLENIHQLSVMFEQPQIRNDKVFRFYIDKGTKDEIYREVLVTSVARDIVSFTSLASNYAVQHEWVSEEQVTGLKILPGLSAYGVATLNNTIHSLLWSNPAVSYFDSNVVERTDAAGVTLIPVGKANFLLNIDPAASYKINTTLWYQGVVQKNNQSASAFKPGLGLEADSSDVAYFALNNKTFSASSILETVTRELIGAATPDEFTPLWFDSSSIVSIGVLETITRELAAASAPDESAPTWFDSSKSVTLKILEVSLVGLTSIG